MEVMRHTFVISYSHASLVPFPDCSQIYISVPSPFFSPFSPTMGHTTLTCFIYTHMLSWSSFLISFNFRIFSLFPNPHLPSLLLLSYSLASLSHFSFISHFFAWLLPNHHLPFLLLLFLPEPLLFACLFPNHHLPFFLFLSYSSSSLTHSSYISHLVASLFSNHHLSFSVVTLLFTFLQVFLLLRLSSPLFLVLLSPTFACLLPQS